ncbi:MAG TPA: hypothetical protein DCP91_06800 [Eggerthellaceae bacterium]|nr:hypothetical protein [Eggerthellaceae bacterium]
MQAVYDFTATINGTVYALKRGQEFEGRAQDAAALKEMGMLEEGGPKAAKAAKTKEAKTNER